MYCKMVTFLFTGYCLYTIIIIIIVPTYVPTSSAYLHTG